MEYQRLPEVPGYIFHAYLWHGLIRISRFFAPEVKPWGNADSSNEALRSKEEIYDYLRFYLGPVLCKLSIEDLEGLVIASGEKPSKDSGLLKKVLECLLLGFWRGGDVAWINHGIFREIPDKKLIPYSLDSIVFEAMCCLIHQYKIAFAFDSNTTLSMHFHYGNILNEGNPLPAGIDKTFRKTFSKEVLILAQVGANELSDFYQQACLFEEESESWRYSFCLQMALNRISNFDNE